MRKKLKICLIAILVIAIIFTIWWIAPKTFPTQEADDITKIECFNGTTGQTVTIEDEETINYIVSQLQGTKYKADSLALGTGTIFNLTLYSEFGSSETLILQPNSKIKQGIYFYVPQGDYSLDELYDFLENTNGFAYKDESSKYPNINDITLDDPRKGEEQVIDDILKYMEVADMVQDTRDEIDANMSLFEEFYCADSVDYIEGKLIVGLKDIDEEKIEAVRSVVTDDDLIVFANADYTAKEFEDYTKKRSFK